MLRDNIIKLRKHHGYTQVSFAKALHVTQSAVSHWETGRASPDTQQIFQIASLFGITVEELSGDTFLPAAQTKAKPDAEPIAVNADEGGSSLTTQRSPEAQAIIDELMAKIMAIPDDAKIQVLNFADFIKTQEDAKK